MVSIKMRINEIKTLKIILGDQNISDETIKEFLNAIKIDFFLIKFFKFKKILYQRKSRKNIFQDLVIEKTEKIRKKFEKWSRTKLPSNENKFLIRIDDFPHWETGVEKFEKFISIFSERNIPVILGVTPLLSKDIHNPFNKQFHIVNEKEINLIKKFQNIEIAMHGLTHQTTRFKKTSEFVGLSEEETRSRIEKGLEILKEFNINPICFIPPYNRIDISNYMVIKNFFSIICGGIDTAKYVGLWITPIFLENTLYIPSYPPLSGKIIDILEYIKHLNVKGVILPLTIHWAQEINNLEIIRAFAETVEKKTIRWESLMEF